MKVTRELIEELRRLHAESLSQSAVVAEDKLLLHIGALLDHIERQDEALKSVVSAAARVESAGGPPAQCSYSCSSWGGARCDCSTDRLWELCDRALEARAAMLPEGRQPEVTP